MAALLAAFVACLLAGMGGRGQILAIVLAARFGERRTLAGLAVAALANAAVSAAIGYGLATIMPVPARMLLLGLALVCCGGSMLFMARAPSDPGYRGGLFTIIVTMLALNLGDRSQFLITGIACAFPHPVLAAVGGAAGGYGALILPQLLGRDFAILPLTAITRTVAALFLIAGSITALGVLGLL